MSKSRRSAITVSCELLSEWFASQGEEKGLFVHGVKYDPSSHMVTFYVTGPNVSKVQEGVTILKADT